MSSNSGLFLARPFTFQKKAKSFSGLSVLSIGLFRADRIYFLRRRQERKWKMLIALLLTN